MVYPALFVELPHACVDEGEAGLGSDEGGPLRILARLVPRNVDADLVAIHLGVERVVDAHRVEELAPDELGHDLRVERLVRALGNEI